VTAVLVAMILTVVLAAVVLVYVAFPHRGREPQGAPWLTRPLGRLAARLRPAEPAPPRGLLSSSERDEEMSRRFEQAEQRLARPFAGRRGA
jgi:hypothetical protein